MLQGGDGADGAERVLGRVQVGPRARGDDLGSDGAVEMLDRALGLGLGI